eukprot:8548839-Pyramimonas_sp.AAC.1
MQLEATSMHQAVDHTLNLLVQVASSVTATVHTMNQHMTASSSSGSGWQGGDPWTPTVPIPVVPTQPVHWAAPLEQPPAKSPPQAMPQAKPSPTQAATQPMQAGISSIPEVVEGSEEEDTTSTTTSIGSWDLV